MSLQLPCALLSGYGTRPRGSRAFRHRRPRLTASSKKMEIGVDSAPLSRDIISMKLEKAAKQLEALGNPTRLKVYRTLVRAGDAGLPVGRLQEKLKIAASTLSHHLHRL